MCSVGPCLLNIPVVSVPEVVAVSIALPLRYQINRGLAALRDIALGRDLKKFLAVCCVAYLTMEFRILVHCFGGRTRELVTPFPEVLSLRPQKSAQASTAFEPRRVVKQPSSASGGDLWLQSDVDGNFLDLLSSMDFHSLILKSKVEYPRIQG
ncbi:hypothetical protein MUK42_34851 [Musa troglodytarum]|uniref:Uncharacterized protein n=1 Tax=Musa troglodytarum TaxID=320322 RepID=A0A9E7J8N6_9LILI|nr:hypothetical protein MUK42_34851 [Musa troglodytarum]